MITAPKSLRETDERLERMEAHLNGIYTRTSREMAEKADAYFASFEKADAKRRKLVEAGKLSEEDYRKWRKNKMLYGLRFADFRRRITHELAVVNESALAYINGVTPEVFALNYNNMGADITTAVNGRFDAGISFDLVDADTVRLLASEDRELLPQKKLDIPKDERWNAQKMQSELLQGIMQGESIPKIAARMEKVVGMNEVSAVRNARTMITGAQNNGRMESMRRAESMGIVLKRIWMSAEDGRVRKAHAELDGQTRGIDEPFVNAIGAIMYPGDPHADPSNVYNCRCTLGTEIVGFRNSFTEDLSFVENHGIIEPKAKPMIGAQKFTEYLLNHEKSRGKSKGFEQVFAFNNNNWHLFKAEIKKNFNIDRMEKKHSDQFGDRYEQVMEITGANGRKAFIRTAWILEKSKFAPRFVTAYLCDEEDDQ